jgi:hypothetical protein
MKTYIKDETKQPTTILPIQILNATMHPKSERYVDILIKLGEEEKTVCIGRSYEYVTNADGVKLRSGRDVLTVYAGQNGWLSTLYGVGIGIPMRDVMVAANNTLKAFKIEQERIRVQRRKDDYARNFAPKFIKSSGTVVYGVELSCMTEDRFVNNSYANIVSLDLKYKGYTGCIDLDKQTYVLTGRGVEPKRRMSTAEGAIKKFVTIVDEKIIAKAKDEQVKRNRIAEQNDTRLNLETDLGITVTKETEMKGRYGYRGKYEGGYEVTNYYININDQKVSVSMKKINTDIGIPTYNVGSFVKLPIEKAKALIALLS